MLTRFSDGRHHGSSKRLWACVQIIYSVALSLWARACVCMWMFLRVEKCDAVYVCRNDLFFHMCSRVWLLCTSHPIYLKPASIETCFSTECALDVLLFAMQCLGIFLLLLLVKTKSESESEYLDTKNQVKFQRSYHSWFSLVLCGFFVAYEQHIIIIYWIYGALECSVQVSIEFWMYSRASHEICWR